MEESQPHTPEPRKPKKDFEWERIRDYLWNFCRETPIHGMKYLAQSDRPLYERLWWTIILLTCFYLSYSYSMELWYRLNIKPSDQLIETRISYLEVVTIPSPAITFCDNNKSTSKKKTVETTSFICGQGYDDKSNENPQVDIEMLIKMAPVLNSTCTITHGYYGIENVLSYCETMFTRTMTQHGVCYTFNMLDVNEILRKQVHSYHRSHGRLSDWTPELGYKDGVDLIDRNGTQDSLRDGAFPKRANGWQIVFNITLGTESDGMYCADDKPGIKISLHNPVELPRMGHRDNVWFPVKKEDYSKISGEFMDLTSGQEYYIDIDPEMNWSNENTRSIQPQERSCYFNDEKSLKYFRYYTKANCENECLINMTIQRCGCVDFYMPHENGTSLCTSKELECMIEALDFWKRIRAKVCHCYSSCKELKYNSELYYKSNVAANKKVPKGSIILTTYTWDIKYMSREQRKAERKYLLVDFIANCGGVFGLFCGMSIVSVIDFTYYGTLRIISNFLYRKEKDEEEKCDE